MKVSFLIVGSSNFAVPARIGMEKSIFILEMSRYLKVNRYALRFLSAQSSIRIGKKATCKKSLLQDISD